MSELKLEHVSYLYSEGTPFEKCALDDISLTIEDGSFIGIIGHTGSGKSTLVQHLNGLVRPSAGRVLLDGKDIWEEPKKIRAIRFRVGLVFQYPEYQLFEETVYKDIAFGPINMGVSVGEIDVSVREAARFVGLSEDYFEKSPFDLSGGEKRRAAIAGVIAMRPDILVLDEPTAGLDPHGRDVILAQIREYKRQTGKTVILVSHSMEDIAQNVEKVLVMNKGKIAMFEPVEEVFSRAAELMKIGLDVPQVTRVFLALRKRGIPVDTNVYTVSGAEQRLKELLTKGGGARA